MIDMVRRRFRAGATLFALTATFATSACTSSTTAPERPVAGHSGKIETVAQQRLDERTVDLTVRSNALAQDTTVRLLTPPGWHDRTPERTWPVLYLLPGGDGDHTSWTTDTGIAETAQLRDVLIVIPGMPMFGFYTDWAAGGSRIESFHLDEMIPLLERDFGASRKRAIAGISQGGYGALKYAALRPGMFGAAASYSGWLHPLRRPEVVLGAATFLDIDGTALWGDPVRERARWMANDLYHLAGKLVGIPVYLSSGDGSPGEFDPPDLPRESLFPAIDRLAGEFPASMVDPTEAVMGESTRLVADRLQALHATVTTHLTAGTHSPPYWHDNFHRSLPILLDALGVR
ncbi:alpha/beta hydrolase family protein [Nocardia sp. XZ_19_369]|uniref:alpha/beta hydrolase n=1 Tax=Nocardia sp. XZ_19_369 TaxID=2769487 RepID=UPI0018900B91|nr:alpha/beta hydrolase family protein [Nocardia sp. XZ_19_369]